MGELWVPVSVRDGLPLAVIVDPDIANIFDDVYDEISAQFDGTFGELSDFAILLVLAKRCHHNPRFADKVLQCKLGVLVTELSAAAESAIKAIDIDEHNVREDSTEADPLPQSLVSLQLALRLGRPVDIVLHDNQQPLSVTFISFPRARSSDFARLWFSSNDRDVLSRRVRWDRLSNIISKDIWDLSPTSVDE